jgi:TusA-related sulfurtransferase
VRERRFKHGASKTKEYRTWTNIRDRCHNPHHAHYNRYGGRGIKVCDQWNCSDNGFEKFFSHMGKAPSENLTIERVDNDGDYCPENCIWATQAVQAMNRNVSLKFEWNGKIMTLPQIAHAEGKCPKHVYRLVKINKKSIELAVQKAKAA